MPNPALLRRPHRSDKSVLPVTWTMWWAQYPRPTPPLLYGSPKGDPGCLHEMDLHERRFSVPPECIPDAPHLLDSQICDRPSHYTNSAAVASEQYQRCHRKLDKCSCPCCRLRSQPDVVACQARKVCAVALCCAT